MSFRRLKICLIAIVIGLLLTQAIPGLTAWHHWRGNQALVNRRLDDAKYHFQSAEYYDSKNGLTQFLLARCFRMRGQFVEMRKHLDLSRQAKYDTDRIQREYLLAFAQIGDFRTVSRHIPRMLENPGDDGQEICEALVNGYFLTWQFPQAMSVIEAWRRDFPNDPQPYLCIGRYFEDSQNHAKAVEMFSEAIKRGPHRTDIRIEFAEMLQEVHRYDEAKQQFTICLKQDPNSLRLLVGYANSLFSAGDTKLATEVVQKALALNKEDTKARFILAKILLAEGKADTALPHAQAAFDAVPHEPEVRYTFAVALRSTGNLKEAARHFEAIEMQQQAQAPLRELFAQLSKEPTRVDIRHKIGTTLLKFGHPDEGEAILKSILIYDPDHDDTHRTLAEYYASIGRSQQAENHQRKIRAVSAPAPKD